MIAIMVIQPILDLLSKKKKGPKICFFSEVYWFSYFSLWMYPYTCQITIKVKRLKIAIIVMASVNWLLTIYVKDIIIYATKINIHPRVK